MEALSKIGIDWWGMLLYLVNFGLLLGVLGYFLYPKLLKAIDHRRETIKKNIEETNRLQKELQNTLQEQQAEAQRMKAEFAQEGEALKRDLAQKRTQMTQEIEAERDRMMDEAKELLRQKRDAIVKDAEAQVISTMKKVLLSVMQNRVPEDVVTTSVNDAWKKYKHID